MKYFLKCAHIPIKPVRIKGMRGVYVQGRVGKIKNVKENVALELDGPLASSLQFIKIESRCKVSTQDNHHVYWPTGEKNLIRYRSGLPGIE